MIVAPPKSDYRAAVEDLLAPLLKIEQQLRDCIVPLERMKRLRFKSPDVEAKMAAHLRDALSRLAPFLGKYNLDGAANSLRQTETVAVAAAKRMHDDFTEQRMD